DVRRDPRQVCLKAKCNQVEHQLDLLVELVELADRRLRQIDAGEVALLRALDAPLDLAHGVEILREDRAVARTERLLQRLRPVRDEVEETARLARDRIPLLRRVA